MRPPAALLILTIAAGGLLAGPAPGSGERPDVRVSISTKGTLQLHGTAGADRITIVPSGEGLRISLAGTDARLTSGRRCKVTSVRIGSCRPGDGSIRRVVVDTGDGDDVVQLRSRFATTVALGPGNDRIRLVAPSIADVSRFFPRIVRGGPGDDVLIGSEQADILYGEGGNDDLDGKGGSDTYYGGEGDDLFRAGNRTEGAAGERFVGGGGEKDTVNYLFLTVPVIATLDGNPNDGIRTDPKDDIEMDVERLIGGKGDDELYGNDLKNSIFGSEGNDKSYGLGGPDNVFDSTGLDLVSGGAGEDNVQTSEGVDQETGDTAECGDGDDYATVSQGDAVAADCEHVDVKKPFS